MGQILGATCVCGYKGEAVFGAGRSDFLEVCDFPHYCDSCNEVVSVDIFKEELNCPKCKSSDVHSYEAQSKPPKYKFIEKLSDKNLNKFGFHRRNDEQDSWYGKSKTHVLLRGPHHCPKCDKDSLKFFTKIMFD